MTEPGDILIGSFHQLGVSEPYPGIRRTTFDSAEATVTSYVFDPGARFPIHRHAQEQITLVEEGTLRMQIGAEAHDIAAPGWSVVPGDVEHGITAGPDGARITAIVVPRRASADSYEVVAAEDEGARR